MLCVASLRVTSFKIPSCDRIYPFNEVYSKIYTISYYSGFYSSLKDKNCAYESNYEFDFYFVVNNLHSFRKLSVNFKL